MNGKLYFSDALNICVMIGAQEIVLLLFILVIFFGASKLPEIARALGKSVREFKKAAKEIEETKKEITEDENLQDIINALKKLKEEKKVH